MRTLSKILEIIQKLDDLPADHELETEDLWEALRRIEVQVTGELNNENA